MSEPWTEPRDWPPLAAGEAHVWLAYLPSALPFLPRVATALSPEEVARAEQFRFETHRERWQLTRALLRSLLGRYANVSPGAITFAQGAHGKPALAQPENSGIHFNTSHSGDYAVFAMTRAGDVGVDIEQVREDMSRCDEIAQRYFAPGECAHLASLPAPERTRAFFDCWARKEAFVKARGDGLFSGLDQFEVSLTEPRLLSVANGHARDWWLAVLPPIEGYAGATVVKSAACTPRFWRWSYTYIQS
jgi:4'-phosphopantetheinyl transferase